MEPLTFVILVFAAYRITRFFILDTLIGADLDSGSRWSQRLDRFAYTDQGEDRSWWRGRVGDLLSCYYCLGFWVAFSTYCLWYRLWWWDINWTQGIEVWAVAGGAVALMRFAERD
jgi:hypothetical protein